VAGSFLPLGRRQSLHAPRKQLLTRAGMETFLCPWLAVASTWPLRVLAMLAKYP